MFSLDAAQIDRDLLEIGSFWRGARIKAAASEMLYQCGREELLAPFARDMFRPTVSGVIVGFLSLSFERDHGVEFPIIILLQVTLIHDLHGNPDLLGRKLGIFIFEKYEFQWVARSSGRILIWISHGQTDHGKNTRGQLEFFADRFGIEGNPT